MLFEEFINAHEHRKGKNPPPQWCSRSYRVMLFKSGPFCVAMILVIWFRYVQFSRTIDFYNIQLNNGEQNRYFLFHFLCQLDVRTTSWKLTNHLGRRIKIEEKGTLATRYPIYMLTDTRDSTSTSGYLELIKQKEKKLVEDSTSSFLCWKMSWLFHFLNVSETLVHVEALQALKYVWQK